MIHTKEERRSIAEYAFHNTASAACRKYKVGSRAVKVWMIEFGLHVERRDLTETYKLAIADVREGGMSFNAAARKYNLNVSNLIIKAKDVVEYTGIHPCVMALGNASGFAWSEGV